jgi:hypothetical protein
MNVLLAVACLAAFCFLAACGDDDVSPADKDNDGETWDTRDAFRPGSGRFGWMVCPGAEVKRTNCDR